MHSLSSLTGSYISPTMCRICAGYGGGFFFGYMYFGNVFIRFPTYERIYENIQEYMKIYETIHFK
jgi:hypothetical protein